VEEKRKMIASTGMSIKWSELHSSNIKMIDNNDTLGGRNATDKNLTRYREASRREEMRAPGLTNLYVQVTIVRMFIYHGLVERWKGSCCHLRTGK